MYVFGKISIQLVVWDLKGEEGNSHGDGKVRLGKQMLAGPGRDSGIQKGVLRDFAVFLPAYLLSSH